jgi:ubiquinone/menaquinone biosynthesis C-methylase UbiE
MADYYRKRATEYDALYECAAWRSDLAVLKDWLAAHARGKTILEVAAGTGYWTGVAAPMAKAITATDINAETLAIAAERKFGKHIALVQADAWCLPNTLGRFDAGMAHLWWSHIRRQDRRRFLSHFASRLQERGTLLMIDQNNVADFGAPISRWDVDGNSYQTRWLDDGERFEVVKNYPDHAELEQSLATACDDIRILPLTHFWAVRARFRPVVRLFQAP